MSHVFIVRILGQGQQSNAYQKLKLAVGTEGLNPRPRLKKFQIPQPWPLWGSKRLKNEAKHLLSSSSSADSFFFSPMRDSRIARAPA
eukprot:1726792-Amphidinium_carterae.1